MRRLEESPHARRVIDHRVFAESLRACRANVILCQYLEHACPGKASDVSRVRRSERDRRKDETLEIAPPADREQWNVNREDEYKERADHKGGQRYREQCSQHE